MAIWGFISVILTQQSRDKTSFFFMLVLPIAIIVIIGTSFGGPTTVEIGVVGTSERADQVADALMLQEGVKVERVTLERARENIRRFDLEAAVVVDTTGGGDDGKTSDSYGILVNETSSAGFAARTTISRVVDRIEGGVPADAPSGVVVRSIGDSRFASQGAFALTSAQNLVLFTFITALTAAVLLVRARDTGVLRRALAAPISSFSVITGVGAGWLTLALLQTAIIMVVGALGFGVNWGNPLAGILLIVVFALVGTGAGLLLGSAVESIDTVGSAAAPVALVLAAIGGCMVPVEIFPEGLRTISQLTPHYWALEGWKALMFDGAGVADIAVELGVLSAFAVVLIGASTVVLRRSLVA